jgi:myo-inositol-1(or 4)-monophosphatase
MEPSPAINIAIRAIRSAGSVALYHFDRRDQLNVREKGPGDLVSDADLLVEKEIMFHLRKGYPQWDIISEESSGRQRNSGRLRSEWQWIIDPIDGTSNFLHGQPHFSIVIALAKGDDIFGGLIYQPILNELFLAEKGRGAYLNNRRIRISPCRHFRQALLVSGFPLHRPERLPAQLEAFNRILTECDGVRSSGSAALDLAYTAAGRYDGCWESGLSIWDMAAGSLLMREAGGLTSDFNGRGEFLQSGNIVAGNPSIQPELLARLAPEGTMRKEADPATDRPSAE